MGCSMALARRDAPGRAALSLAVGLACLHAWSADAAVSVSDFGAVGDGKTDDTAAFVRALGKCDGELLVPAGQYRVANLKIPEGTLVRGVGVRSVLTMPPDVEAAVLPGNDCTLTDLKFVGTADDKTGPVQGGMILLRYVRGVSLDRLVVEDSPRAGVFTDRADHFRVSDCRFKGVAVGVSIVFSHQGIIAGNFVEDAKDHGMQFWGNWQFEQKDVSDLVFSRNVIRNAGGGGIWGTGGVRVVMTGNTVDGAGDICLDYEWCDDSTIVGNTVRNGTNAGISLFYGCASVTIAGNSVVVTDGDKGLRHGIWLTDPDWPKFPQDLGHRVIAITGNTVRAEGPRRHGVVIGVDSHDVTLSGNVLSNADVLDRTTPVPAG